MPDFPTIVSTLAREATVSERRPTGTSTFPFSVNERLSGKRKNRPEHVFPGGSWQAYLI